MAEEGEHIKMRRLCWRRGYVWGYWRKVWRCWYRRNLFAWKVSSGSHYDHENLILGSSPTTFDKNIMIVQDDGGKTYRKCWKWCFTKSYPRVTQAAFKRKVIAQSPKRSGSSKCVRLISNQVRKEGLEIRFFLCRVFQVLREEKVRLRFDTSWQGYFWCIARRHWCR